MSEIGVADVPKKRVADVRVAGVQQPLKHCNAKPFLKLNVACSSTEMLRSLENHAIQVIQEKGAEKNLGKVCFFTCTELLLF